MAKYILRILKSQLMVMLSWGVSDMRALKKNEGIIFHVRGMKFVGWVKIVYNEGTDLFNIFYMDNDMQTQKIQEGIFFDELVNTIDYEVEKTENYEQDVRMAILDLIK